MNQIQIVRQDREPTQSRWGHHCCDYQTFLRIRRLHKAFWEHVRKACASRRWNALTVNQHGKDIPYCHELAARGRGETWDDCVIRLLYQQARMPSPEPVPLLNEVQLKYLTMLETALREFEASQTPPVA